MVTQFVSSHPVRTLTELGYPFAEGTHPIGRLDGDSEGLVLLTTNKRITKLLFESAIPHKRTYLVLVIHKVEPHTVEHLRRGVEISMRGRLPYTTQACEAEIVTDPGSLYAGADMELYGPHTWLKITLTEGKFRQVRKMVRTVGHRCKRLIRLSIENLPLGDIAPGEVREISEQDFFEKLQLVEA